MEIAWIGWPHGVARLERAKHGAAASRRGITAVELIVVLVVCVVILAVLLPRIAGRTSCGNRSMRDATHVRGIHQGLVLFGQSNKDKFPLPSELDADNFTVDAQAESKDTTANIVSVLIYQSFFTPELCVSPSETNAAIGIDSAFEYTEAKTAVNPARALWDPGFNADFTAKDPKRLAGFSYAHRLPSGTRRESWRNALNSNPAMVGNRGPKVTAVVQKKNPDVVATFNTKSNTLLILGGRESWEGNVVYNDNSIQFETSMAPETKSWDEKPKSDTSRKVYRTWRDVLFFDEPEDPNGINNYLVNVKKAGEGMELIWD